MRSGDAGREPFGEDPGRTAGRAAAKATNLQDDFHGSPMRRNIGRATSIPTVDMVRNAPAVWTGGRGRRRAGMDRVPRNPDVAIYSKDSGVGIALSLQAKPQPTPRTTGAGLPTTLRAIRISRAFTGDQAELKFSRDK